MKTLLEGLLQADSISIDDTFIREFHLEEDFEGNQMLELSYYDSTGYFLEFQFTWSELDNAILNKGLWEVNKKGITYYFSLFKLNQFHTEL